MTVHFTADLHLGHAGIIAMSQRPFASIEEHDRALVANWNAVVAPRDDVWVVGDFAHRADPKHAAAIFWQLAGSKHLVLGNHDGPETQRLAWASISVMKEIKVDSDRLVLMHYALRTWPGAARGAIHLYGHSHGRLPGNSRSTDVGVDCWDYRPVSLAQIKARLALSADVEPENDGGGMKP